MNRFIPFPLLVALILGACSGRDESEAERRLDECFRFFPEREDYYFDFNFTTPLDSQRRGANDSLQKKLMSIENRFPTTAAGRFASFWSHSLKLRLNDGEYNMDSMRLVLKSFITEFPNRYHPYLAVTWFSLDTSETEFSQVEATSEYIHKAIEKASRNPVLYTWAAYVEFRKDPTSLNRSSIELMRKAEDLDSTFYLANSEYYKLLAATEDSIKGSQDIKKRVLQRCIRLQPKIPFAYAKMYDVSNNYYERMANLDSAIRRNDRKSFATKAQLLFYNNLYDEVVQFMNSVPPQVIDTNAFIKKAYSEYFTGRKEEAERSLAAYSLSPARVDGEFHHAYMEMSDKNFEKALELARKQLAIDDTTFYARHHVLLINLLIITGRKAEARTHFEQYRQKIADDAAEGTPEDYGIEALLEYPFRKH